MQTLKASVLYFALVFGTGFILGPIRILWIVPRFGARMAELMEVPIMIAVTVLAARWVVRRFSVPRTRSIRAAIGGMAVLLMLVAEFTIVLWLRRVSISEYFDNRDPVSGTVYYIALALFAAMPLLVGEECQSSKLGFLAKPQSERSAVLIGIKLLHTTVWLLFAGCIIAIPFAGAWREFRWVAILTGLVVVECAVLAVNRGRCPLTDLASRYTEARSDNFDIYLPLWLARRNKVIFGTLFAIGELFVLGRWVFS